MHTSLKNNGQLSAGAGGGLGGTLILSYISRFGPPLLAAQNFEFQFFLGGRGVRKINNMFWGMVKLLIIFWMFWGVISIHFGDFLKVKVQYWKMCLSLLNFKYFWACLIFLIFFGEKSRCWVQACVFRKIESIPNGVRHSYHLSY